MALSQPGPGRSPPSLRDRSLPPPPSPSPPASPPPAPPPSERERGIPRPCTSPGARTGPGAAGRQSPSGGEAGARLRRAGGASWRCRPRAPQTLTPTQTDAQSGGRAGADRVPRPSALRGARQPRPGAPPSRPPEPQAPPRKPLGGREVRRRPEQRGPGAPGPRCERRRRRLPPGAAPGAPRSRAAGRMRAARSRRART